MATVPFVGRKVELDKIVSELSKKSNDHTMKRIISLYGIGGAGKTTLLNKVKEKIEENGLEFGGFNVNENLKYESLPEFVNALSNSFISYIPNSKGAFENVHNAVQRYQHIVGKIEAVFTKSEKNELGEIKKIAATAAKRKGKRKFDTPSIQIGPFKINTVHYEGQELDGEAESRVWLDSYEEAKQRIIKERYKDAESQKYLMNPSEKITPILLESLRDSLYPKGFFGKRKNQDRAPIKVLFILDTYEKLKPDINDWLLKFLLPQLNDNYKNVFDYRFIISGREQLIYSDHQRRWDNYRDTILDYDIHRFTKDEVKDYLSQSQLSESLLDEVYEETDGLAYLVSIWVDTHGKGNALIIGQAANRIFWWKTEEQKEWIRAAAFKDYYDQDFLAVMLGYAKAKNAFDWLKECHEVTRPSLVDHNKLQLHTTVRRIITKATQQQSEDAFQRYTDRVKLYEDVHSLFPLISDRENVIKLCVFEHFNQVALENIYPTQGFSLHNFAKEHMEWFEELTQTFKMKTEIKTLVHQYFLLQNKSDLLACRDEIVKVWQNKKNKTNQDIEQLREDSAKMRNEIKQLSIDINDISEQIKICTFQPVNAKVMENKNMELRKGYHLRHKIAIVGIAVGVLLVIASFLSASSMRAVLGYISALFLSGGLTLAIWSKAWKTPSPTIPPSVATEPTITIYEMKRMEERKKNSEDRREKLNEQVSNVESKIEQNEKILTEPYVIV
ncbi:MAG: AAA family ATPase [Desulfobacterales bacterium]|nr:AAA family ATPase [Desulfobacterales bacterium]